MSEEPESPCRLCRQPLRGEPLLRYQNMPKAAQHFPDVNALAQETGTDLTVWQCACCGLVQLSQEPVAYFREVIRAAGLSQVLTESKSAQFREFIQRHSLQNKKIIEIGCGRGEFLSLLDPLDVEAYGLEHAEASVATCVDKGLRVAKGYLETGMEILANGPFDAFLLLMFLEHFPDPHASLQALHRNLAPGAVGLVEVPNFGMVIRTHLFSEFVADHLMYFTQDTLRTVLSMNGFDLLEFHETRDDYVLSALVQRRERLDLGAFLSHQGRIEAELHAFIDRHGEGRVAIWGAGHQALAVMAMTQIAPRIRYVIDSAPFKQGLFTPATHVPILAPSALESDPVDAVIVMAASYSDEVAGILRRGGDRRMAISILRESGLEVVP